MNAFAGVENPEMTNEALIRQFGMGTFVQGTSGPGSRAWVPRTPAGCSALLDRAAAHHVERPLLVHRSVRRSEQQVRVEVRRQREMLRHWDGMDGQRKPTGTLIELGWLFT
jgi:hypothetical protein